MFNNNFSKFYIFESIKARCIKLTKIIIKQLKSLLMTETINIYLF